ncbi:DegT/DnrJ/EryC1/StrS family aminotransferase [Echinicola jeungdonensis]|uniref:DegT/DnrJ/EryC1/StrS family aminotransferase n=1 Tax=Echinicola jeungdonensis TaxID=709343 RepID=A0ABV5J0P0_9BACT|nr:DegT/DnrJ/EryC1/StrS family aminotransferase [Echinicola jeungdonensis]MDN3667829.1 DegT/DnrJ/EryC1/StrS family aminotransferase [Echinicola jeungdonensis]
MKKPIPFLELTRMHEDLAEELKAKFDQGLKKGVFSGGEEVAQLENRMSNYLNVPNAIGCANGTDALELALRVLGIGAGDEVIVPALTWVSTAEVVKMVGAKVVFCEVDHYGLLDINQVAHLISPHTKAIISVHLYGKMVDMERLMKLAKNQGIEVIEDAAQAFGAFQNGKSAGCWGDIGCFSFYPTKNLGALGEAGLLTTQNDRLAYLLRLMINHGQFQRDNHELIGRNSRIDTLQAAFLNVKLDYFEAWQNRRKALAKLYLEHLQHLKGIQVDSGILTEDHNAHLLAIQTGERDELRTFLDKEGIGTAIHYPLEVPAIPAFGGEREFPMAHKIAQNTLSLPLHPYLKEEEVRRVCVEVSRFFGA